MADRLIDSVDWLPDPAYFQVENLRIHRFQGLQTFALATWVMDTRPQSINLQDGRKTGTCQAAIHLWLPVAPIAMAGDILRYCISSFSGRISHYQVRVMQAAVSVLVAAVRLSASTRLPTFML